MTLPPSESYREMILSRGLVTIVDVEEFEQLSVFKWCVFRGNGGFYAGRVQVIDGKKKFFSMHRIIMNVSDRSICIDHINHNTLDNRKANLRVVTHHQNLMNKKLSVSNRTGYKGVSFCKADGKFKAGIKCSGISTYLGSFNNPLDAARRYDEKARELFGEFACLNFPII